MYNTSYFTTVRYNVVYLVNIYKIKIIKKKYKNEWVVGNCKLRRKESDINTMHI